MSAGQGCVGVFFTALVSMGAVFYYLAIFVPGDDSLLIAFVLICGLPIALLLSIVLGTILTSYALNRLTFIEDQETKRLCPFSC
jgi:hypothetical protein